MRTLSDRYEIETTIGTGGMAEVYLGRDVVLGRSVAIKTLLPQYASDPQFLDRFRREAQSAAALNHPNIVGVYDTGSDDGTQYIVMEYVQGRTLRDVIRDEGPLLPERAAEIAAEVCDGLGFAHAAGIVHRDVKPANIMLTPTGQVKIADFGIARAASVDTATKTAMVLGTAQYFSPEQAQSQPVDARSDLYSLGVVLYEMITRQVPFTGSSPVAIAYKQVKEPPMIPSRLNPDVPPDLEAIVLKALAKNPDNRYADAQEMREDLDRFVAGAVVEAPLVMADATGMMNPLSDDTVIVTRKPLVAARRDATPEQKRRRTGIWLISLIALAILGVSAWAIAGLLGGPSTGIVPDVLGKELVEGQRVLEGRGFKVEILEQIFSEKYPAGQIASQTPEAGESIDKKTVAVKLQVSKGLNVTGVPDVVGKSRSAAIRLLEGSGFKVDPDKDITYETSDKSYNSVISQTPSGGSLAAKGSNVRLVLSNGPGTVEVPNVVGFNEVDARNRLIGLGFDPQTMRQPQGDACNQPEGRVCRQDPGAGSRVRRGSTVTIWITDPPPEESPTPTPTPSPSPSGSTSPTP